MFKSVTEFFTTWCERSDAVTVNPLLTAGSSARFELYCDWNGDVFPAKAKISDDFFFLQVGVPLRFLPSGREHEAKNVQRVDVWDQGSRGVVRQKKAATPKKGL